MITDLPSHAGEGRKVFLAMLATDAKAAMSNTGV